MEDATMIKREYEKPMMQVIKTDVRQQILAGSITGVTSTGLDAEEELILPARVCLNQVAFGMTLGKHLNRRRWGGG